MFLNNFLLSTLEDVSSYFVFPYFYDLTKTQVIEMYAPPYGLYNSITTYSEPVVIYLLFWLAKFFDPHFIYNMLVLISGSLAFLSAYKLIGLFSKNKFIQSFIGLNYVFSPYFLYQSRAHPQLMQIWMPAFFLYLYFKYGFKYEKFYYRRFSLLGIFLGLIILSSNYLGYFLCVFLGIYTLTYMIVEYVKLRKINWFAFLNNFLMVFVASIISLMWLYPFFSVNYLTASSDQPEYISRPLEDFVYFSSRPWYYLLPSVDNPLFGNISKQAITILQTNWGHYLTNNYFKTEHTAAYIGFGNLILLILGIITCQKHNKREYLNILLVTNIILIVLTFPPFIIANSHTIYLPSFILYKVFPMFRVLARLGFLINLINFIFISFGCTFLWTLKSNKYNHLGKSILFVLCVFSFLELYVPLTILKTDPEPQAFIEMKDKIGISNKVAVYPKEAIENFFYWTRVHRNYLVNPINFKTKDFDANKFTNGLNSCEGIKEASQMGVDYLVVYDYNGSKNVFFDRNENLKLINFSSKVEDYPNEKHLSYLYEISNLTLHPDIYVYKLNQYVSCK